MNAFIRFGAVAACAGGLLRIAAAFIPFVTGSAWLELLYAVIDLGLLFGLIAVLLFAGDRIGSAGMAFGLAAIAAMASIIGPDATMFGVDFYLAGASLFSLALAGCSLWLIRGGILVWPARLWLGSFVSGLFSMMGGGEAAFGLAGVLLGVGFVTAGRTIRPPSAAHPV